MAIFEAMSWHGGEDLMHQKLHVPADRDNPTVPMLSQQAARMLQSAPLLAIGTLDAEARPWTSLWGGEPGFSQPLGQSIIGIRTSVASHLDPVVESLVGTKPGGEIVKEEGIGRMVSGLTFDLATRKRVKLYGRMIAGALQSTEPEAENHGDAGCEIQLVLKIEQSLGNCPKYASTKSIVTARVDPQLISDSPRLTDEAMALINKSDMFWVSSRHEFNDMDTNYRGGPRSFVRVFSDETSTTIVWPEYSGNRLYQTLGNLQVTPLAGLCFPDFDTGNVLYLTGTTQILIGADATNVLPRSNLVVKLTVTAARLVAKGLPFRGTAGDPSPYNPSLRYLRTERPPAEASDQTANSAKLIRQTRLTPTISRFSFSLANPASYLSGQYVTFDFSSHLDVGYSHMRDDDPTSINDDFIRTFTVSSVSNKADNHDFDITIRRVGPVTAFLFKHGLDETDRDLPLEVDLKGFGGEFNVSQRDGQTVGFIAAGVGITPLLPALAELDPRRLVVLWALRRSDINLAAEVFRQYPESAKSFMLFLTGPTDSHDKSVELAEDEIIAAGCRMLPRRLEAADVTGDGLDAIERWYICTNTTVREQLLKWLSGKETIYEDFNF